MSQFIDENTIYVNELKQFRKNCENFMNNCTTQFQNISSGQINIHEEYDISNGLNNINLNDDEDFDIKDDVGDDN